MLLSAALKSSFLKELISGWLVIEVYLFNLDINGILSSSSYALAANINAVAAYKNTC